MRAERRQTFPYFFTSLLPYLLTSLLLTPFLLLKKPIAESRSSANAMRAEVLRSLECLLGRESYLKTEIIVIGIVGIDGRWVGIKATAKDFDRNIEAQHLLPLRVGTIVFSLVGVVGLGADQLTDEILGRMPA